MDEQPVSQFNLDLKGSISEASFDVILRLCKHDNVKRMIEFGPGRTTIRFAQALPDLHITALEHDTTWLKRIAGWLNEKDLASRVTLVHAPLSVQPLGPHNREYLTYTLPKGWFTGDADLILIDGPPGKNPGMEGRGGCLYRSLPHLKFKTTIVCDNMNRPGEQRMVKEWQEDLGGLLEYSSMDVGFGLGFLRVRSE